MTTWKPIALCVLLSMAWVALAGAQGFLKGKSDDM